MKMLKTLSFCAALMTAAAAVPVTPVTVFAEETENPASGTINDSIQWTYDTKTQTLTFSGKGSMSTGKNDQSINKEWSCWREECTKVIIEDGITEINDSAFYGFSALTTATLPEKMDHIGAYAFSGCEKLVNLTMPKQLKKLGGTGYDHDGTWEELYPCTAVFQRCSSLESITIPEGITLLDSQQMDHSSWAEFFYGCTALKEVHLPSTLTRIGDMVFRGCTALETLEIPESVTSLGYGAFYESGLKSVVIPDSIKELPDYLFDDCADLAEIQFPAKLTKVGENVVHGTAWCSERLKESPFVIVNDWLIAVDQENCSGEITVPGNAKNIAAGVFGYIFIDWDHFGGYSTTEGVTGPIDVVFSEGVEVIGPHMFHSCSTLKSLEFPSTLKKIEVGQSDSNGGGMFRSEGLFMASDVVVTIKSMDCEIEDAPETLGCYGRDDLTAGNTIRAYDGSTAEAYAKKYGYTFESLGAASEKPPLKPTKLGDIDLSNIVDVSDAVILARYLVGDDS
ncbi:MAG: leucine-rich repeat protein, partial [Oscillospiraceae bacterium]|nr:leucine-rich repeat protein [Oscillospiraceae bacterium]